MEQEFAQDAEFQKLLARARDVDLTAAALELGRDDEAGLDFTETLSWIEDRADELGGPLAQARDDVAVLSLFGELLGRRYDLCGDAEAYDRAGSSYLHEVVRSRRGIPISLSVLYLAVGERAGITLHGVAAPGHFLVRYEGLAGPVFCDPFSRGAILTWDECIARVQERARLPAEAVPALLDPAPPRAIILRMLNNLKILHARHENWRAALPVQRRLALLQPSVYAERRDLALVTLRAGHPGPAVTLLEQLLKSCPAHEREMLERAITDARQQLFQWN